MKILQINNHYNYKGGADTVFMNTGQLLEESGHEVIYYSMNEKDSLEHPLKEKYWPKQKLRVNPFRYFHNKESSRNLKKIISEFKPQIAHLHIFYGGLSNSILPLLKEFQIPVVMTVHDYRMFCPAHNFLDSSGNICELCATGQYFHCIKKRCVKKNTLISLLAATECFYRDKFFPYENYVDHFIFVSKFSRNKHLFHKPELQSKSSYLYNFSPTINADLTSVQSNSFLYLGRLSKEKGVLNLVKAWENINNSELLIAGNGPQKSEIEAFINSKSISNIKLLGFLNQNELKKIVRKSKFIIVPSTCYEHNPMAVIEAYAEGIPVIGSELGGITEVIPSNIGSLFDPFKKSEIIGAVNKAAKVNATEYAIKRENALNFCKEKFSAQIHLSKLIDIYKTL